MTIDLPPVITSAWSRAIVSLNNCNVYSWFLFYYFKWILSLVNECIEHFINVFALGNFSGWLTSQQGVNMTSGGSQFSTPVPYDLFYCFLWSQFRLGKEISQQMWCLPIHSFCLSFVCFLGRYGTGINGNILSSQCFVQKWEQDRYTRYSLQ